MARHPTSGQNTIHPVGQTNAHPLNGYGRQTPTLEGAVEGQAKGRIPLWQKLLFGAEMVLLGIAASPAVNATPATNQQASHIQPAYVQTMPIATATVTLVATATPMPGLENVLSYEQLISYATELKPVQPITPEVLSKIDAVNKTLSHLFTGRTFESSRFATNFLPEEEYKALEGKPGGTLPDSAGSIGLGPTGEIFIYVNKDSTTIGQYGPLEILRILSRETGNAEVLRRSLTPEESFKLIPDYKAFLNEVAQRYNLGDITDTVETEYLDWIKTESLQTLYEAAVFHYLEEAGVIVHPPLTGAGRDDIFLTVDEIVKSKDFAVQATVLDWYRAFNYPPTSAALKEAGKITYLQAIGLFNHYVGLEQTREGKGEVIADIVTAIRIAPQYRKQIEDASLLSRRPARFVYFP